MGRPLAGWVTVDPHDFVILEGVTASRAAFRPYLAYKIWVDAPRDLRLRRGIERDGESAREQWKEWMESEDRYIEAERPREHADLVLPGDTNLWAGDLAQEAGSDRRTGHWRRPSTEMAAREVAVLVDALESAGVQVWVDGGWGVDALLSKQRREHDDLDLVVDIADVLKVQEVLRAAGYTYQDGGAPLSFMVVDREGWQVDVHPVTFNEHGDGVYQMENGQTWLYPAEGLAGTGQIGDREVRCLTPALQMRVHAGYELTGKDHDEVRALHDRFGADPPPGYEWPRE